MMGKRIFKLLIILVLFPMFINAQKKDSSGVLTKRQWRALHPKPIGLLFGYHSWNNSPIAAEIGISRSIIGRSYESVNTFYRNFVINQSISAEVFLADSTIVAPKYSLWINSGRKGIRTLMVGLHLLTYTDFNQNGWALRPEIGFYLPRGYQYIFLHYKVKLTYSYNLFYKKNYFPEISVHTISIVFFSHGNVDLRRMNK